MLGRLGGGAGGCSNGKCRLCWTIALVSGGDSVQLSMYRTAREIGRATSGMGNGHNGKVMPPDRGRTFGDISPCRSVLGEENAEENGTGTIDR